MTTSRSCPSPARGRDHLIDRCASPCDHDIHGSFTDFVGQREAVAGRLDPRAMGARTGISHLEWHSCLYQRQPAARYTFAVVGDSRLQWMSDIVVDVDVFTEKFLAQPIGEKAALIVQSRGA